MTFRTAAGAPFTERRIVSAVEVGTRVSTRLSVPDIQSSPWSIPSVIGSPGIPTTVEARVFTVQDSTPKNSEMNWLSVPISSESLLIVDEFGFDKIERAECGQAASLLYKIIDARSQQRATALVTNVDFDAWGEYLGDPPLAMAFLDRLVDGAIILKIKGKSYRAHRAKQPGKIVKAPAS